MADENNVSSISKASSYEEMADFWDTHSLADFDDQTYPVEMTFDPAARRNYIVVETELFEELRKIAKTRHVSVETLINLWLRQQVDAVRLRAVTA